MQVSKLVERSNILLNLKKNKKKPPPFLRRVKNERKKKKKKFYPTALFGKFFLRLFDCFCAGPPLLRFTPVF